MVGQRCVVFMQTVIGDAAVVVGPTIFRIDLDRLGAIGTWSSLLSYASHRYAKAEASFGLSLMASP
jgi:hypothetical protein